MSQAVKYARRGEEALPMVGTPALLPPTTCFFGLLLYEELFFKLYCFGEITALGALFTAGFTIPLAMVLGQYCAGGKTAHARRWRFFLCAGAITAWIGTQLVYFRAFKTFYNVAALSKLPMVAGSFGGVAAGELLLNWLPVAALALPVAALWLGREWLFPAAARPVKGRMRWLAAALGIHLAVVALVFLCGGGGLSLRYLYFRAAAPELEAKNFGVMTLVRLELQRVSFGILPDEQTPIPEPGQLPPTAASERVEETTTEEDVQILPIDFPLLMEQALEEGNDPLWEMHRFFSQAEPTRKNQWTGYFQGKNLVWIVAESFCTLAMDPQRTPTLWKLAHEGFRFENFYTPLWGVSTSDGEYVTTTGLIPKPGVWSYSLSAENHIPFSLGNQFRRLGYRTLAFHNFTYTYYDRDQSYPNMGYDYYALGSGLELEEQWPLSDLEMMENIVPRFVGEEPFAVYCLTVSGHLNYTFEESAMARRHRAAVEGLPYSEKVLAYLAAQMELELAVESLLRQLEEAGELEDTVIVLSGDHYPYGLSDEEYSELLGHPVDPNFEIYKNTWILWNAGMEKSVTVDTPCSSLDVLPTLSNLFGLPYDSRLMAGRDVLSGAPGMVVFSNYSFLTQEGAYHSEQNLFTRADGSVEDPQDTAARIAEVQNLVAYSAAILDRDYYRVLFPEDGPENS